MKRLTVTIALALVPAAALAADAAEWKGFYLGGHLGEGHADTHWQSTATLASGDNVDHSTSAPVSGFHLGFRGPVARNWLLGVEAAYSWTRFRTFAQSDELARLGAAGRFRETDIRSTYTVTGQAGYARDRWMAYGKAGVAASYVYLATLNANAGGASSSTNGTAWGWTAGGGFEWLLQDRWSVGVEYDHYRVTLKDRTVAQSVGGTPATYRGFTGTIDAVVARLNYRF